MSKSQELIEPRDATLGQEFLFAYIACKKNKDDPVGRQMTGEKKKDYNLLAREIYRYDSYKAMPEGTKTFIGRCAARKREHPSWTFQQVINHEHMKVCQQAERLWKSILDEIEDYYWKHVWRSAILPRLIDEWNEWAEKNPQLAFIED